MAGHPVVLGPGQVSMITITVNGKWQELDGPTTIAVFVQALPVNQRHVAVARNGEVIPRDRWPDTPIEEGDVLEVVRMVGGGGTSTRELIETCRNAICRVVCRDLASVGTGFFIRPNGTLITCNHVVAKEELTAEGFVELRYSQAIEVSTIYGTFQGQVIHALDDMDPYFNDYSVVSIKAESTPHTEIGDYNSVHPGDDVLILGYPLDMEELTATKGMVAAKHRSPSHTNQLIHLNMLRIDGAVNAGNSGGPLLNDEGRAIGIVTLRRGSIKPLIDQFRRSLEQAAEQPFINEILHIFEMSDMLLNTGLGEAISIQYVRDKLTALGL